MRPEIIQILTGFVGSLCFGILFNIRGKRLAFAALGGLFSWSLFIALGFFIDSDPVNYFIVALAIGLYSHFLARALKTPTTTFVITSLIPLIPGSSLYYTMVYAFEGDFQHFAEKGLYTLKLSCALALGIIITSAAMRIIRKKV